MEKRKDLGIKQLKANEPSAFERYEEIKSRKFDKLHLQNLKNSVKKRSKLLKLEKELESLAVESIEEPEITGKKKNKKEPAVKSDEKKSKKAAKKQSEEGGKNTSVSANGNGVSGQEEEVQFSVAGLPEDEARELLWKHIAKKQIPKLVRVIHQGTSARLFNSKKLAQATAGLVKRQNSRLAGKPVTAARRAMKEMLAFWKKNEREERDLRKRAEKEAAERRRIEEEQREARRQAKKLNFLITQTELYSHFVGRKQQGGTGTTGNNSTAALSKDMDFADVDDSVIHAEAERIAKNAAAAHQAKLEQFQPVKNETVESSAETHANDMDFMNPSTLKDAIILEQPTLMQVTLKSYQLKGLTWLASLYEQVQDYYVILMFFIYYFRVLTVFWLMKWVWERRFSRFPCWRTWPSDKTTGDPS